MENKNIEFKTPNGYIVTLKPEVNYGQSLQIRQLFASQMSVDPKTKEVKGGDAIQGSVAMEVLRKNMEFLIVKIVNPEGVEMTNKLEAIDNMPRSDGIALENKVNELTKNVQIEEGKRGA